jgi:hypothetical protein
LIPCCITKSLAGRKYNRRYMPAGSTFIGME